MGWKIVLQWINSHCGIPGNEKADILAKNGCNLQQPHFTLSYQQICGAIKHKLQRFLQNHYAEVMANKTWSSLLGSPLPMNLPRSVFTANFRILTGHDFLQNHLCRIGVADSPVCVLCPLGAVMDFTHLTSCPALSFMQCSADNFYNKASFYWAARGLMADVAVAPT